MAYSGTVGTTVVSVQKLIDHGARRCGKLAEELTSEQVQASRTALYYALSNLINIGIQYWCINKKVYGLKANQYVYDLPVGGNDVLQALYRQMNRPTPNSTGGYSSSAGGTVGNAFDGQVDTVCTQVSTNGNIAIDYGTNNSVYIGSIGILPGVTASMDYVLEYSQDGISWSTLYDPGVVAWINDDWVWHDIEPGQNVQYYRIRARNGSTLSVRELYLGNNSTEITMARLNRDDYTNLPNKNFTANQPFQYWLNRTIPQAQITLWPVPSNTFVQMTVWYSRQIMDVGSLSGELEIPQRWMLAVQNMLAHQMSLELPGVPMDRIQYLEGQAEKYLMLAEQEERDKSPIYFAPDIGVYTR